MRQLDLFGIPEFALDKIKAEIGRPIHAAIYNREISDHLIKNHGLSVGDTVRINWQYAKRGSTGSVFRLIPGGLDIPIE